MKRYLVVLAFCAWLVSGCGDNGDPLNPLFNTTNTGVAPIAVDDDFDSLGNSTLNFGANSIFGNDTRNGATILAFDANSTNGGTVALNADGSFDYTAPTNFTGVDQFTYTLQNPFGTSQATVRIQIDQMVRYVNNSFGGGDGSQAAPFATLGQALAAARPNEIIFVFRGNGNSAGSGGNLQNGQQLIGESLGLQFQGRQVVAPGQSPLITGTIEAASNNTVAGFDLQNPSGDGVTASNGSELTIRDNQISNISGNGVDLFNVGGTNSISNNSFVGIGGDAIFGQWAGSASINIIDNIFNDDDSSDPDDAIDLQASAGTLTVQANGNSSEPLNSGAAYNNGVELEVSGNGSIAYVGSNNTLRNTSGNAFMAISGDNGILSTSSSSLVTSGGLETSFLSEGAGNRQHLIRNSNLSDDVATQIAILNTGPANATIAVRNTVVSGQMLFAQDGIGTTCLDIEGSTAVAIAAVAANGTLQIEEAASLSARNNKTQVTSAGVTNVDDGTCNI